MSSEDELAQELLHRFETWQNRLSYLGVSHWRFSIVLVDIAEDTDFYVRAQIHDQYDDVDFYVSHDFLDLPAKRQEEVIVHEWLHVAWRTLDAVIESVETWMPEATYKDYEAHVTREREKVVDRTARQLLNLYDEKVVS